MNLDQDDALQCTYEKNPVYLTYTFYIFICCVVSRWSTMFNYSNLDVFMLYVLCPSTSNRKYIIFIRIFVALTRDIYLIFLFLLHMYFLDFHYIDMRGIFFSFSYNCNIYLFLNLILKFTFNFKLTITAAINHSSY